MTKQGIALPATSTTPTVDSGSGDDFRASTPLSPVTEKSRIESIDVLRGVAVLGILAMNIYAFAMPFPAYYNPLLWGGADTVSKSIWFITHFLVDQKFLPVFSMLFGAGLILMTERSETGKFAGTWYRRNLGLLVIGAIHGYLIWFGDILFTYAFLGLLIYPLRRKKAKTLLILGSIWMLPALATSTVGGFWMENMIEEVKTVEIRAEAGEQLTEEETKDLETWRKRRPMMAPTAEDLEADVAAHLGTYAGAVTHRAPSVVMMQTMAIVFLGLWRVGGLMLIGMGLMKLGVFSARKDKEFYRRLLLWGYGLGFPLVAVSAWQLAIHDWNFIFFQQRGAHWNYVGGVLVSLGHISVIMLAVKGDWFGSLERRLAAVGRMAFTNYLMQSILCTTIFYGYGLGLYGSLDRPAQMIIGIAVCTLQLLYSAWWLERFRYGPAEWFWRLLTYGTVPALRRKVVGAT
jgi:uncharacterized protein